MAVIRELTTADFEDFTAHGDVLIDFWASWCGPCRALGRLLEEAAPSIPEEWKIGKVEVDSNPELAARFDVMTVPKLVLFRNGRAVREYAGVVTRSKLTEFLA